MMKKRSEEVMREGDEAMSSEWEMRPGGMLVQKRCTTSSHVASAPVFTLRIAYESFRYNISINSHATFGELKKLLASETGLQPNEQKLMFKGKERGNGEYLDRSGVKHQSKVVLAEDPLSKEKRFIEMRKNIRIQSAHRAVSDISVEVDKLSEQVAGIQESISNGRRVPEVQITTLIEMFMRQAVKLDLISTLGDSYAQKTLQGKRAQRCVETLDALKNSNAKLKSAAVTPKWETFDPPTTANWELFD